MHYYQLQLQYLDDSYCILNAIHTVRDMVENWDRGDLSNVHIIADKQLCEHDPCRADAWREFIKLGNNIF